MRHMHVGGPVVGSYLEEYMCIIYIPDYKS